MDQTLRGSSSWSALDRCTCRRGLYQACQTSNYGFRIARKKPVQWRAVCGGSWGLTVDFCQIGYRVYERPDRYDSYLGFRVVRRKA